MTDADRKLRGMTRFQILFAHIFGILLLVNVIALGIDLVLTRGAIEVDGTFTWWDWFGLAVFVAVFTRMTRLITPSKADPPWLDRLLNKWDVALWLSRFIPVQMYSRGWCPVNDRDPEGQMVAVEWTWWQWRNRVYRHRSHRVTSWPAYSSPLKAVDPDT